MTLSECDILLFYNCEYFERYFGIKTKKAIMNKIYRERAKGNRKITVWIKNGNLALLLDKNFEKTETFCVIPESDVREKPAAMLAAGHKRPWVKNIKK